ncbi:HNH endonuclease [Pantoea stewartii]|uniref:HNH endonuclease n=1 Tax=Pantoea stewartii TaxID=66269 RepID=UPI001FCFDAC5|nr:HNH endonuclease [Pantoea stewartii]
MMKLTKNKREALRKKFKGCCAFCGSDLPDRGWTAEYIGEEYVAGGIATVCSDCRTSKGSLSPEQYRVVIAEQLERAKRHSSNLREALRYGLIIDAKKPVKFWFEKQDELKATSPTTSQAA